MFELHYGRLKKRMVSFVISCLKPSCIIAGYRKVWLASSFHNYLRGILWQVKEKGWLASSFHDYARAVLRQVTEKDG